MIHNIVERWLARKAPTTREAYGRDLADFASWLEVESIDAAAAVLMSGGSARANEVAGDYLAALEARGLAPATINRRLSALRSLLKLGRLVGATSATVDVEGVRREAYRDTRGPAPDAVRAMLAAVAARPESAQKARDFALLRVFADLGLRRNEVRTLDLEHLDGDRLDVLGKGKRQRRAVRLPRQTLAAVRSWLAVRGSEPGPLFVAMNGPHRGSRLSGVSLWSIVRRAAADAQLDRAVWPHAFRHAAVTTALELGFSPRDVRHYSRHADIGTVMIYDDARQDRGGEIADAVAAFYGSGS
jgi:integrase/recombinase XerC